ncbi:helix-turn-helix domain-containing protein [Ketogulonicigenium vulgare]|uniref:helix-turn-helix domain-containing protein n=1 Tax=Ketogulonicigenium vulgare TaxID=92945 RepID=UPI0023583DD4|nr:helix-turn-helix domain-containing protein [Ketogulonicigenium vulgare]
MGSITQQPAFQPITRRDIMAAVNTCSRDLGIRQGAVVVLDALLSCLPCQGADGREAPVSSVILLTVYASNETLCFRAKGLTDRQLRRHLETLEQAGLIRRRDSANGKRFPVMQNGKPIGAFGLDLSPLFARSDELLILALRRREEAQELRGLKAQILRLRAACAELHLDATLAAYIDGLRNLVRRATLTLTEARAALAQLTGVLSSDRKPCTNTGQEIERNEDQDHFSNDVDATRVAPVAISGEISAREPNPQATDHADQWANLVSVTNQTPASDGQNVRHIEQDSDTKKRRGRAGQGVHWKELTEVSAFYPEPCSAQDATRIAFEFGRMLRISQDMLVNAIHKLGLWELLRLEDRIAKQVEGILSPDAYVRSILRA